MTEPRRPSIQGCIGSTRKLNEDELDHWVFEACKILGGRPTKVDGISKDVAFLSQFFNDAHINMRHAGLLGWTSHWVQSNYVRTADYCADTFIESWCQALAAKYCSQEAFDSANLVKSRDDAPVQKRERKPLASGRRSLFD